LNEIAVSKINANEKSLEEGVVRFGILSPVIFIFGDLTED
jgi:hypothetical protein